MKLSPKAQELLGEILEFECVVKTTPSQVILTAPDFFTVWINRNENFESDLERFLVHLNAEPVEKKIEGGHLMTIAEFKDGVDCGGLMDDDGDGYYSNGVTISKEYVDIQEIARGNFNKKYTHVVWYNK